MKHPKLFTFLSILFLPLFQTGGHAQTSVMAWGDNRYGQLGTGTFDTASPFGKASPTAVSGLSNITGLADGFYHSVALLDDGTVMTWGYNYYGELGIGSFNTTAPYGNSTPTPIANFTGVIAVAAGTHHSLALLSDGTIWAWGWNTSGQLGDGSGVNQKSPVKVTSLSNVIAIAAGGVHSLALKADGTVWAWGGNLYGELGDGGMISHIVPEKVGSGTAAIACGQYHSLALSRIGTVYAWGSNTNGQIGDGTTTDRIYPTAIAALSGVAFITGGAFTSLAIKTDGTVWGWGWNAYGQIGDGTTIDRSLPAATQNLTGAIAIATGQAHSLALKSDGTVWAWGWNAYGQIGNGAFATVAPFGIAQPQQITGITGATSIAGGGNRAHAILSTSTTAAVSGLVTLEGLTPPYMPHTLTLQFRPIGGGTSFLRSALLGTDGSFSVGGIPPRKYTLWTKAEKWLATVQTIDTTAGDVAGLTLALSGGDANNDNVVDTADFNLFIGAVTGVSTLPGSGYDARVDFNDDGVIDTLDFNELINNYGVSGAN